MSYAAYKMMHLPMGIENCASGFITNCSSNFAPQISPIQADDLDLDWSASKGVGQVPNLIVSAGNILEVYLIRVQEEGSNREGAAELKRGGLMAGITGATLELVCHYRLNGNVESMAALSIGGSDIWWQEKRFNHPNFLRCKSSSSRV